MTATPSPHRLFRTAAALLGAGLLAACAGTPASAAATPRIVGGTGAAAPAWAAQVWIVSGLTQGTCGGELVSSRWVLTAAHCATNERTGAPLDPSVFHLRIGTPGLAPPTAGDPGIGVDSVLVDPNHKAGQTYGDVALLHLPVASTAVPVAFGPAGAAVAGATPDVLGWGETGGGNLSPTLLSVTQPIIDPAGCASYNADFVAESMICAGGVRGQDSCNGDSGGPLALSAESPAALLLGTVDFGSDNCGDGSPAVYQRVTDGSTADWLRSVLVRPAIAVNDIAPVKGDTETLKASSGWADASYRWDLDGNGTYTDAKGASVTTRISSARTISVQAVTPSTVDSAVTRITLAPVGAKLSSVSVHRTSKGATVKARFPGSGSMKLSAVSGGRTIAGKTLKAGSARMVTGHLALTLSQRRSHPQIKLRWTSAYGSTVHSTVTKRLS